MHSIKLIMLYPHPTDTAEFERRYVNEHLPLMRRLVGPHVALPTYTVRPRGDGASPYYRVSEIEFPDGAAFDDFVGSGRARTGYESAVALSSGGGPVSLVCDARKEAPPALHTPADAAR